MVEGTKDGTTTDFDGHFSLDVPAGKKIVVSYVGMTTQTLSPKPQMEIVLMSDAIMVEEVVVTGMQKMDKRLFTGSSTKVSAADAKIDGVADISRALEGRAAGVSVQNVSGTFGAAPKIRVRGATSIYGSSKPLWVVDGVIMEDIVEVSADDLASGRCQHADIERHCRIELRRHRVVPDSEGRFGHLYLWCTRYGWRDCRHHEEGYGRTEPHQLHRRVYHATEALVRYVQHHELARPDVGLPRAAAEGLPQLCRDGQRLGDGHLRQDVPDALAVRPRTRAPSPSTTLPLPKPPI